MLRCPLLPGRFLVFLLDAEEMRNGGISPPFLITELDGSKWLDSGWGRFVLEERSWLTHGRGDWVGPRHCLNAGEKFPHQGWTTSFEGSDVSTAVTKKNDIFLDKTTQFVPHRRQITSPLQSLLTRHTPAPDIATGYNSDVSRVFLTEGPLQNLELQTNSVVLSPRANYTDWATATCWRNLVPTFADRGVSRRQRGGSPTVVNLSFLDQSHYFSFKQLLICRKTRNYRY
jgi:hypothetical protein